MNMYRQIQQLVVATTVLLSIKLDLSSQRDDLQSLGSAKEPKLYLRKSKNIKNKPFIALRNAVKKGRFSHREVKVDEIFNDPTEVTDDYENYRFAFYLKHPNRLVDESLDEEAAVEEEPESSLEVVMGYESECALRETVLELHYAG